MNNNVKPKVTVGLPVFNGEKYLRESILSILDQSMTDFELIIVDNASTDGTKDICREFVSQDERVSYIENEENIGASPNHNKTLAMAKGEYFVWQSYDDIRHPKYLELCSAELDQNPQASTCHSLTQYIDEDSEKTNRQEQYLDLANESAVSRFKEMIRMDHKVETVLAMMRTDIMKKTDGLAPFSDSDRVLMAEMCLYGQIIIVQEYLVYRRDHPNNSVKSYANRQERMAWFDPSFTGKISLPHLRQYKAYVKVIRRSPLAQAQKDQCKKLMRKWLVDNRRRLYGDVEIAFRKIVITLLRLVGLRS